MPSNGSFVNLNSIKIIFIIDSILQDEKVYFFGFRYSLYIVDYISKTLKTQGNMYNITKKYIVRKSTLFQITAFSHNPLLHPPRSVIKR